MNTMTELQMPADVRPIDLYAFFKEEISQVDAAADATPDATEEDTEDGPMPEANRRPEAGQEEGWTTA